MSDREEQLRARAQAFEQGHVFAFWDALDPDAREHLLDQLEALDFELVKRLAALAAAPPAPDPTRFEPPELFTLAATLAEGDAVQDARREGLQRLEAGTLGCLLVAGGQASRLGYDGPKGEFPIGPISGRSLFEFHARRLLAGAKRHATRMPFYVMTSPANDAATRAFFARNDHFGLQEEDVFFFSQAMLPALDVEGRILLAGPGELFLAPNGHGGVLAALSDSEGLEDARRRGLETFSFFQVDNPLASPLDPLFIGLHALAGAEMSSKVVGKRDAAEKVGVLGRADGTLCCIEYSDLPGELREARNEHGELLFRAGNIATHLIEIDFLTRITEGELELPWHVARKRMRALDERGELTERDGFKFEIFVFDALGHAKESVTLEVERAREFSPVKNAQGLDSPESTRRDLCRLHAGWVKKAGGTLPDADAEGAHPVEVCPLFAESEAEFVARGAAEPRRVGQGHLYE